MGREDCPGFPDDPEFPGGPGLSGGPGSFVGLGSLVGRGSLFPGGGSVGGLTGGAEVGGIEVGGIDVAGGESFESLVGLIRIGAPPPAVEVTVPVTETGVPSGSTATGRSGISAI